MDQLRDGLASRLILVGIEGADAPTRARLSKQIAQRLRADPAFVTVNNGEPVNTERDRAFLFNNRYLLSPAVTPARFSEEGLHAALSDSIDLLASPAGLLVKSLLPRDPTGEMVQLLDQLNSGRRPKLVDGAWASRDGARALMLMQTRASGSDTDAQQRAMAAIRAGVRHGRRRKPFRQTGDDRPRRVFGDVTRHHQGPGQPPVHHRRRAHRHPAVARLSFLHRAGIGFAARHQRRAGRHRGGQPGLWVGARHHPGIWHCADRRGGGLFDLPVCAIGTARRRPADLDQALLAHHPPGCADLDIRLCFAAAVRLSRSGATWPVFDCRPGRGRHGDPLRPAAPAAGELSHS